MVLAHCADVEHLDPETRVTATDAAHLIRGLYTATITRWVSTGRLKPVATKRWERGGGLNKTHRCNLFRLGDILEIRKHFRISCLAGPPKGYITTAEAGKRIGCGERQARQFLINGTIDGITLAIDKKRSRWFISEAGLQEYFARLQQATVQPVTESGPPKTNPLICGDHDRCLEARREKFLAAGRRFSVKCLAGRRKAG